jgi:two-component system OmpR family sensor kinase
MLQTLRNRLLLSFVAILLIMLVLIGFILLVFLAARPLPTEDTIGRLTATLLDVRLAEAIQIGIQGSVPQTQGMGHQAALEQAVINYLPEEAGARNVRALIVSQSGQVDFDSEGAFASGATMTQTERASLVPTVRARMSLLYKGQFRNPDGSEWLFVAQPITRGATQMQPDTLYVMVAAPVPHPSLREVFRTFGNTFFVPLVEAGLIGLAIAVGLAVLIAGSVARPLQRISQAARRIALGDYRQRVPARGPREVQALAESFNEMVDRVATTQQVQRDFLANVSHDLRTPLTSIQGFSQAIAEGVASDPESAQRAAQIIHDEAARLNRMVESLLDLARLEAGEMNMLRSAVAPSDLLHGIGESISVKMRDKGLHFAQDVPPDLPRIAGDGDRLAQVFTNLLDNAIEHTPSGGTISLNAHTVPNGLSVAVQDTGEGIPDDDLPRIFERFYQVDKSRRNDRRSGMGLGLAIVRQIIEAHGGTIQVASQVGKGSLFTVWLPLPTPDMTPIAARR